MYKQLIGCRYCGFKFLPTFKKKNKQLELQLKLYLCLLFSSISTNLCEILWGVSVVRLFTLRFVLKIVSIEKGADISFVHWLAIQMFWRNFLYSNSKYLHEKAEKHEQVPFILPSFMSIEFVIKILRRKEFPLLSNDYKWNALMEISVNDLYDVDT